MADFFLASTNKGKIKEFKDLLGKDHSILTPDDLSIHLDIEENGKTFEENALIKANEYHKKLKIPVIADDSGLVVDALGGMPGVFSARFAGNGATDGENNAKLLALLKDIPEKQRTARFVAVIALKTEEGHFFFNGITEGLITTEPKGENGFGYDPVFYYPPLKKTFAELSLEGKNIVSHRKKAADRLKEFIFGNFCPLHT